MLKDRQLPESDENVQRIKEYLSRANVKCKIDILTYVIGTRIKVTDVLIGASREEIIKDFDTIHSPTICALFDRLSSYGIIFPHLVVLNNIKNVYVSRLQLSRHDLYRVFTDNGTHWLSFIKLPNEMSVGQQSNTMLAVGVTVLEIFDYVLAQKNESGKYRYDLLSNDTFCNLVDEAIDQLKHDVAFNLSVADWRRLVHSVKSYLVRLQMGIESPEETQITATFVAYSLKTANGAYDSTSVKTYIEAAEILELMDSEPEHGTIGNVGLEDIDVKGQEEVFFYSDGPEDAIDREKLKNLSRAVVCSFKSYTDDHKQMVEAFENDQFVGYESLEEYGEKIQKFFEFIQRHQNVIFGAVIALVLAFVGYLLKKKFDERGTAAEESIKQFTAIIQEIEQKTGGRVDFAKYGVVQESLKTAHAFSTAHRSTLDDAILHMTHGYDLNGLTATINGHVEAIRECMSVQGSMMTLISDAYSDLHDWRMVSEKLKSIKALYIQNDFHKIPYTRKPLYEFISTKNQGHAPWNTPENKDYNIATPDISTTTDSMDCFWNTKFTSGGRPANTVPSTLRPYSNLGPDKPENREAMDLGFNLLKVYGKNGVSGLNKLLSGSTAVQKQFETLNKNHIGHSFSNTDDPSAPLCWPIGAKGYGTEKPTIYSGRYPGLNAHHAMHGVMKGGLFSSRFNAVSQIANSIVDLRSVVSRISAMLAVTEKYNAERVSESKQLRAAMKKAGDLD
jgi:hypothetical protein